MPIFAVSGLKLEIGGVLAAKNADFVEADFDAQTWTEAAPVESAGTFGDTSESITFDAIGQQRRMKLKGTRDAGTAEYVLGIDYADDGQIAILAAEKTPHDYAFRVTFNDAPAGGTPSQRMFVAKVMSVAEAFDTANNVMKLNVSLGINSNIVRVDAAEAG